VVTTSIGSEQSYQLHYRAEAPALLKVSVPYFPGWTATLNERPLPIVRADHALMGIVVPAGEGDIHVKFKSNYFAWGAMATAISIAIAAVLLLSRLSRTNH
jgi:uncharacterized membrane protein YfhO